MNNMFPSRRDFRDLRRQFFDDTFDQVLGEAGNFKTDIIEDDNEYTVEAELPGMDKENIELDYHDNILSISGKQESETNEEDKERNYIRRERSSRSFSRQFLIRDVDEDNISARFENGILKVKLPKKESDKPENKRIDIQ
ncbi:HSP20 family protein [Alkalibacterium putridalgicola]|uniref:HSP20 family protein n=1 Tax=Alkalibacterium putridalgicola TaxID=426703 RepID=A0A1H7X3M1_9LACT|nr:Hsp20/alpha crystallin family protein [Alkalibacterium putridalgicola]GEK90220.1 heat-shock protein Hsp20 [Alkalibacterium putridalgicola]SEM28205.1 HSP20 family protein [Alkalibacterium putridalgicola]